MVSSQVQLVKTDIDQLLANLFVETAQPWVIPYLGDLVGSSPLPEGTGRLRADVARTIEYRQRKGTLGMLAQMASDVTGWKAHVVDFYRLLGWTQQIEHQRPVAVRTPDLREKRQLGRLGTPFESSMRAVDLRPAAQTGGWHSLSRVGLFLWRLGAYPIRGATPEPDAGTPDCFRFSPLGIDLPLFHLPRPRSAAGAPPTELDVPAPIAPHALVADLVEYYGEDRSFVITTPEGALPANKIVPMDLEWWAPPPTGQVAVDVRRGRFRFAPGESPASLQVSFAYGFSHAMGGGSYTRPSTAEEELPATYTVSGGGAALAQALEAWSQSFATEGVIEIQDSATYTGALSITLPRDGRLVIRAAQGERPVIRITGSSRNIQIQSTEPRTALTLLGLCIDGGLRVASRLDQLTLRHCTLVPRRREEATSDSPEQAWVSIRACSGATDTLRIRLDHVITGPLKLNDKLLGLTATESIIDGLTGYAIMGPTDGSYAPALNLQYTTVYGQVKARSLEAEGCILQDPVELQRKSASRIRFSYLPGSGQVPAFTSTRYGDPGYGQLSHGCPREVRTGAEDGAEMGAFHALNQPQREQNLISRLREYLPVGREPGLIYVS